MQGDSKGYGHIVEKLLQAQEKLEQRAFDAINEQDKLLGGVRQAAEQIEEMGNGYDMFAFEVHSALQCINDAGVCSEQVELLGQMLEQNESMLAQLMQLVNDVLEKAEYSSEVIHGMEEEIALSADAVAEVQEYFDGLEAE
ncbi:MAG: hypothetical protein IJY09_04825 [Lachnospiraceae bacterium]|nr:hypothetical protein [Lachnospiraceae bacterium]